MKIYNLSNMPNPQYALNNHSIIYLPTNTVSKYPDNISLSEIKSVIITDKTIYINFHKLTGKTFKRTISSTLFTYFQTATNSNFTNIQTNNLNYTFTTSYLISPHLTELSYPSNKTLTDFSHITCEQNCVFLLDKTGCIDVIFTEK